MQPVDLHGYTPLPLPWTEELEQKQRLWKTVAASLSFFLFLFLLASFVIDPPEIKREQLEKVPERLAKVMLQKKRQPPPPPPKPPEPKPELEKPKPEPEKPKPKPKKKPKPVTKIKPKKPLTEQMKKARKKAANSGIMAMKNQLQALQDLPALSDLSNKPLRDAKAVTTAKRRPDLIGRRAADGSGGIQTTAVANPERSTLAGRQTTQIEAPEEVLAMIENENKEKVQQRTREEINLVFDRHKSAFYALYRRALRSHLGLQGRVVFEFSISPEGQVTECQIVSSELDNADLERKLRARVMLMPFENKPVDPWQGRYHIDFLPAG